MALFKSKQLKKELEELKAKHANEVKTYVNRISELNDKLANSEKSNEELQNLLLDYKQKVNGHLTDYIESKEYNVDNFFTNEFKTQFENFVNNEGHSEEEILNKYNELYNKESIYFEGIVSCIDFIRTKRNPKISTEKQILKYILTETGRTSLDSYIEAIALGNTGETCHSGGSNE